MVTFGYESKKKGCKIEVIIQPETMSREMMTNKNDSRINETTAAENL